MAKKKGAKKNKRSASSRQRVQERKPFPYLKMLLLGALVLAAVLLMLQLWGGDVLPGEDEMAEETNVPLPEIHEDGQNPLVTIEMEKGGLIQVELDPFNAPNTVRNFITLAEEGFYDGLIFHRVIPDFMIQGGCPQGTGSGGPGYNIKGEFSANGHQNELVHHRGVISMARSPEFNSAGSQFFITVAEKPHLDSDYAAFGTVISGMDVVDRIVAVPRDQGDKPLKDERIKKVTVEKFGQEYQVPDKL